MDTQLTRTVFTTSRSLEFFTEKELTMQIGHKREDWPIALLKELIDNALDACENAGIPPVVKIDIEDDRFSVSDNGPGLAEKIIKQSLDYTIRVSDKSYYMSPTRGQLGNALKCVYAAPFVISGESGRVEIETGENLYIVEVEIDRIAQAPVVNPTKLDNRSRCSGTKVTIFWPESARLQESSKNHDLYHAAGDLILGYAMLNPHATFISQDQTIEATDPAWEKWKPSNPTSAYWYDSDSLKNLIAAYLTAERDSTRVKSVREFIAEFRGLARKDKQGEVAEAAGLSGKNLEDLVQDGDILPASVERLLSAMKEHSRPVKPDQLGAIGKQHITTRMIALGVSPESIRYKKIAKLDEMTNLPHLIEIGFGVFTEKHEGNGRKIITGLNWSPTLGIPIREFQSMLQEMRIDPYDPVCVVLHIARPRFDFTDKGKGMLDV
jgi:DNA topoisomerase VI subunit B